MEKLSDHLYIPPMSQVMRDRRAKRRVAKRDYAAARVTRQNKDWTSVPYGANWSLSTDLKIMRARAREMASNAPHFIKFLRMAVRNVVGHAGISLQCRAELGTATTRRPNTRLNSMIELAFWEWGFKENCSVNGKRSWVDSQKLFIRHLIRDGEALVQHIEDADNPFGYALKFWDVNWLDENYNVDLPNGNRIVMSIEIDDNDRPVAYWLTTPSSEWNYQLRRHQTMRPVRVPAEEMSHYFLLTEDDSQLRGITWFHAVLVQGKDMHEYTGNVAEQARVGAASLGFLEREAIDETEFDGQDDDEGNIQPCKIDIAPLSFNELPPGYKVNTFKPEQPTQNHAEFKQSMTLDIAAGMDVPGFSLAGDMSSVNYSSARVGLGEERDMWRDLQTAVSDFCRDVYHRWLRSSVLSGKLEINAREYEQLRNPNWRARGWRYVDPQKEVQANIDAITAGLATYKSTLGEQGIDLEEFLAEKQAEMVLFEQYGIPYGPPPKEPATADEPDDDDEPPDDGKRSYSNGHAVILN